MDKSSSLGISPGHLKKYPRGSSVKAWGCPRHPLFINKKDQVIFQCAIFFTLHALCVILGASLFSVVCLLLSIKLDPIIFCFGERHAPLHHIYFGVRHARCTAYLLWSETRSAVLHIYFGVRYAPLF